MAQPKLSEFKKYLAEMTEEELKKEQIKLFGKLNQVQERILKQRKNMGIEEIIIEEIKEQAFEQGEQRKTTKGIQKALNQKKLNIEEIADASGL